MVDRENIVFAALDEPSPPPSVLEYIKTITPGIPDDYRNCKHIPLIAPGGVSDPSKIKQAYIDKLKPAWTDIGLATPGLVEYMEQHVFPYSKSRLGRLFCIVTAPNSVGYPHIDATEGRFHKINLKWRSVIQGPVESMYMITENGNVHVPAIGDRPFLMAGEYPHGVIQDSNDWKYTLAYGSPWQGDDPDDPIDEWLERSEHLPRMLYDDHPVTPDYQRYFKDE